MRGEALSFVSVEYLGSLPHITRAFNIASVIDHGIGELEIVFEKPITVDHIPWVTTFNKPVYVNHYPGEYDNSFLESLYFEIISNKDGKPTDASINILLFGTQPE